MNITTWNVNSVRKRLERITAWLDQREPDVLCLQETKCVDEEFPREAFTSRGYTLEIYGQKAYNGVAIASRYPLSEVSKDLPWPGDAHARGIAATVRGVRIVNLYVPNGGELDSDKYSYKLLWLEKLHEYLKTQASRPLVVCGDYNIAPQDVDVYDPLKFKGQVLCTDAERDHLKALSKLGLHDSFRRLRPDTSQFTWWDYRGSSFLSNQGLRIDHHLVSDTLWERVLEVSVDTDVRGHLEASDHAPVTLHLRDDGKSATIADLRANPPPPPPIEVFSGTPRQMGLFG